MDGPRGEWSIIAYMLTEHIFSFWFCSFYKYINLRQVILFYSLIYIRILLSVLWRAYTGTYIQHCN